MKRDRMFDKQLTYQQPMFGNLIPTCFRCHPRSLTHTKDQQTIQLTLNQGEIHFATLPRIIHSRPFFTFRFKADLVNGHFKLKRSVKGNYEIHKSKHTIKYQGLTL